MGTTSSSSPATREHPASTARAGAGRASGQRSTMAWIPGGSFRMGSADFYPEERPVHRVAVDGFWMDRHPVTVGEFRRFARRPGT